MSILSRLRNIIDQYLGRKQSKIDLCWYDGSKPTKQRIADLRYKLGVARGMLGSVIDSMEELNLDGVGGEVYSNIHDMRQAMKNSID